MWLTNTVYMMAKNLYHYTLLLFIISITINQSMSTCSERFPLQRNGEIVLSSNSQSCPTEEEEHKAIESLNRRVDETIETLLPKLSAVIAAHSSPPECPGSGWSMLTYTNASESCPFPWVRYREQGKWLCKRNSSVSGCESTTFVNSLGVNYTQVCGRVVAYHKGNLDAFTRTYQVTFTVEDNYVDGISITHGTPMRHIWTFAAAAADTIHDTQLTHWLCPCMRQGDQTFGLSFMGENYFCDTGRTITSDVMDGNLFLDDPLWDGQGCGEDSAECCRFNSPPYFTTTLEQPTCDDINVRLCATGIENHTPIELIELYVK